MILIPMAIAALATALESSGRRLSRTRCSFWVLLSIIGLPLLQVAMDLVVPDQTTSAPWGVLASLFVTIVVICFMQRATVQRARDAGWGKPICFVGIVPGVGYLLWLLLLFLPPQNDDEPEKLSIAGMRL